jgi:hypothetical protein
MELCIPGERATHAAAKKATEDARVAFMDQHGPLALSPEDCECLSRELAARGIHAVTDTGAPIPLYVRFEKLLARLDRREFQLRSIADIAK